MRILDLRPSLRRLRRRLRDHLGPRAKGRLAPRTEALEEMVLLSTTTPVTVTLPVQIIDNQPRPVALPKFDPGLGQLTSVRITADGTTTADITARNLSPQTSQDNMVSAFVTGSFTLSGPGLASPVTGSDTSPTRESPIAPAGMPGDTVIFMGLTAHPTGAATITDAAALPAFVGPGSLNYSYLPMGFASATETEGNLDVVFSTVAGGDVSIVYTYTPNTVSGFVYGDCNDNNGLREPDEPGIPGVVLNLSGTDDLGRPVTGTTTTDADGFYHFDGLRSGTYTVTETQPAGYLDGKQTRGNVVPLPNSVGTNTIPGIVVGPGLSATNNNFGELTPGAITGFVYRDANGNTPTGGDLGNGLRDAGESGIPGVLMILTGTNDLGPIAPQTTRTDATGAFRFDGLRPGTYRVTEGTVPTFRADDQPPTAYLPGLKTTGNVAPIPGSDQVNFLDVTLAPCSTAENNDFAHRQPPPTCIPVSPRTFGIHHQPTTVALTFGDALDPALARDVSFYHLIAPGRDGRFGTPDDQVIPIPSADYDAVTNTVTLHPAQRLGLGHAYELVVDQGVAGPGRMLQDLNGNCGNFVTILDRGNHILYGDRDGDRVGLAVRHGGLMELYRAPDGEARRLVLYDTLPYRNRLNPARSVLRGHVTKSPRGDGLALIPRIEGANQVRVNLPSPPFVIGDLVDRPSDPPAVGLPRGHLARALRHR